MPYWTQNVKEDYLSVEMTRWLNEMEQEGWHLQHVRPGFTQQVHGREGIVDKVFHQNFDSLYIFYRP